MKKCLLRRILPGVLAFFVIHESVTAEDFTKTGTSGMTFLEIPATARQAAIGDAYCALGAIQDASSIFINPASLGYVQGVSFTFSYGTWLVETNHQSMGVAYNLGNFGTIGLSAIRFDAGDFGGTVTDATQATGFRETGNFNFGAFAVGPSYALRMTDRFSFGITVRYAREGFSNVSWSARDSEFMSSNFLAEVGTLYYTGFNSLRFATNIQSIGFDAQYIADPYQAPVVYRIGAAYDFFDTPDSPIMLTTLVEAIHPSDAKEKIMAGAEATIMDYVVLRGGYKFDFDEEGFTAGLGIQYDVGGGKPIGLDFAYVDYGRFDSVTRFTLNVGF